MPKEAHIKGLLEDYVNLESALNDYAQAKEDAQKRYNRLLHEHDTPGYKFTTHTAAPILAAYDEIKDINRAMQEANTTLQELSNNIKEYIRALNGHPLEVHFNFDDLDHRAGIHTFYLENQILRVVHAPVSEL